MRTSSRSLNLSPSSPIGNNGYKKYLTVKKEAVVLDMKKVEHDSRFDGKFVLTTNKDLDSGEIATTYKNLLQVEQAFWGLKDYPDHPSGLS